MNAKYDKMKKAMLALHISKDWEEVPQEVLWEDGEMSKIDVKEEIFWRVVTMGDWKLIRRRDND